MTAPELVALTGLMLSAIAVIGWLWLTIDVLVWLVRRMRGRP